MMHTMKLSSKSFERMKNGKKTIEYRLNDEKRQQLKYGHTIIFEKLPNLDEKLLMEVYKLNKFNTFNDAFTEYLNVPNSDIGDNIEESVKAMYKYYDLTDEEKYGCLAIHVRKQTFIDVVFEYNTTNQSKNEELITKLKIIKNSGDIPEKNLKNFEELIANIEVEAKNGDGIVVFSKIIDMLHNNEVYLNMANNMTSYELMELATKKLGVGPAIYDECLDEIIDAAIESDIPENVWRIALNYDARIKDKSKLEDYIITKKNAWYIAEFITSEFIGTNLDKLVDGLIATKNLKEIIYLAKHFKYCNNFKMYEKSITKLEKAINEIDGGWEIYQEGLEDSN